MDLCVNATFPDGKGNAIDCEHVSGDAHVDGVPVCVRNYGVKTIHHNFFEAFVDGPQIPKITLPVLNPLEVGNSDPSSISKNVWNNEDFLIKQDLVRLSRSRTVGAFADDARLNVVRILVSDLVLCCSRKQDVARLQQQVFARNG